ncbi:anaerobic ribonucleoside-triphosphate reductase activating protein [Shumkonia mesophila]|uniref:anaerobic ribonucleoside-triphosphate reductase activating protein n=1 Tax=Shumkonia mesophila TaxID=2838854 RepID=UPI00293461F5|nr:anaerobic ribonucleoside-triphosphate reductase activating protein [Shumkonia mesophila]
MAADDLVVGGMAPLTTIDYPGRLAAVLFCQGCPWRCPYCHNPHLLKRQAEHPVAWGDIRAFLRKRRGFLDAVVVSGGEPLLQAAVVDAVAGIKAMGFSVALHTGGSHPARLRHLLPHLDWVGFDAKTAFDAYAGVTGIAGNGEKASRSLAEVQAAGVAYEVRTTVDERLVSRDDLLRLADDLAGRGVRTWALQECRESKAPGRFPGTVLLDDGPFLERLAGRFDGFTVRRA